MAFAEVLLAMRFVFSVLYLCERLIFFECFIGSTTTGTQLHHKVLQQVVLPATCLHITFHHGINVVLSIAGFTSKQAYKMGIPAIGIVAVLVANVTFSAWQSPPGKTPCACMQHLACIPALYDILASVDLRSPHIQPNVAHTADCKKQYEACRSHSLVVTERQHIESGSCNTDTQAT